MDSPDLTDAVAVSVVLPCLDERDSVGACVDEARRAFAANSIHGEVIVVDNGSSDGSADVARAHGARVVSEPRRGYGQALRTGFSTARGDVVVMADADQTYPLERLAELAAPVLSGDADLVLGGRLADSHRATMPVLHRRLGTPVLTFLISRASGGLPVRDSQSGFRAFRRSAVEDLALRSTGMELASEMLIKARRGGLRLREIPTGYRTRVGQSKLATFADGWRHLRTILLLAPDLLLVWPGALLAVLGMIMTTVSLISPTGIDLGSLQWQPIFFSTIALVLGTGAFLSGAVLAHRSDVVGAEIRHRFSWVGTRRFSRAAGIFGVLSVLGGLAIDVALFFAWVNGGEAPRRGTALASLAQTLLILGPAVGGFGLVARLIDDRRALETMIEEGADAGQTSSALRRP